MLLEEFQMQGKAPERLASAAEGWAIHKDRTVPLHRLAVTYTRSLDA